MSHINQLNRKREDLLIQITSLLDDLKEYSRCPCETVSIDQIKYQFEFIQNEIKNIDNKIKGILLNTTTSKKQEFDIQFKSASKLLSGTFIGGLYLPQNTQDLFSKS